MKKTKNVSKDDDEEKKVYLEFRYCKDKCFACKQCGYFWGPGHPNVGQAAKFGY